MATLTERLAIIITGESLSGETAFKKVGAASKEAGAQMSIAQRAAGSFSQALTPAAVATAGFAADLAAFKFGEHVVTEFADATGAVRQFQRVSGATAEDSSRLVAASKVLGVDTDKLGTAMFRLAHNLDGNKNALAKYGIEIAHTADGGVDLTNTMLNVADAVHRVGPGAEADAIAFAAFGRQATALLPILLRGRDGLRELFDEAAKHHEVFNQADLEKGRQFTLAVNQAKAALTGLEIEAGRTLIPLATGLAKAAEKAVGLADPLVKVYNANERMLHSIGVGIGVFNNSAKGKTDLAKAASDVAQATQDEAAAVDATRKPLEAFFKATEDAATAQESLTKAHRSVTTAERDEAQSRTDLNKLLATGKVNADQVAQAEKGVADAAKATADAQKTEATAARRVEAAQQGVLDAQLAIAKVKEGASAEDIEKAELAAAKATRDRERSTIALADAEDKKGSIVQIGLVGAGQSVGTARDQENADLDLADAIDGVKLADLTAKDAQQALTDIRNKGKDGSDDLKKAQDDLKAAQDGLTAAVNDQADAHQAVIDKQTAQIAAGDELRKAQAGDPDWDQKIADAQQKIADAHQNTADRINDEKDALNGLVAAQKTAAAAQQTAGAAGSNVQTSVIGSQDFRPVSQSVVTVHTGADPASVVRAVQTYATSNGGKPRG